MDIFNPQACFVKELKNSWAAHIRTDGAPDKVPIEVVEGIPSLKLIHDKNSDEKWFACALPLEKSWEPYDLTLFRALRFTICATQGSGGLLRLEDDRGQESDDFNFSYLIPPDLSKVVIKASLSDFAGEMETSRVKLLKFIGYKHSAFYISQISLIT